MVLGVSLLPTSFSPYNDFFNSSADLALRDDSTLWSRADSLAMSRYLEEEEEVAVDGGGRWGTGGKKRANRDR
jgi:hypothetical protein